MKISERGRSFLAQGAAWLLLAGGLAAAGATLALQTPDCLAYGDGQSGADLPLGVLLAGVAFVGIGRLLTARRPENRISWLIAWLGFSLPVLLLLIVYTDCAVYGALALPGAAPVAWLAPYFGLFVIVPLFVLLPAWFPDGRFMSGGWARLLWTLSAVAAALSVAASLLPGNMISGFSGEVPIENPFGLPWALLEQFRQVWVAGPPVIVSIAILLAILSFVLRFRRATGESRQQFKWFAAFLSTVVIVHILGFEIVGVLLYPALFHHWSYNVILTLSFGGFPVVIGLTIFKYRLYDIDLIIRRTITYGVLTALLALTYFAGVISLQGIVSALTGQARSSVVAVVSTLGIAALFNPLRRRVQDFIDRRFYRAKYDAEQTLARFAAAARDEVDLDQLAKALVGIVAETMQPEHVSLWLKPGSRLLAEEARGEE